MSHITRAIKNFSAQQEVLDPLKMQTDRIQLIGILGPQVNDDKVFETNPSVHDNNLLDTNTNTVDNRVFDTNPSVDQTPKNQSIGSDAGFGNLKLKQKLSQFYSDLINDPLEDDND